MLEITTVAGKIIVPKDALPLVWYGDQKKEIFDFYKEYLNRFLIKEGEGVIVDWEKRQEIINACNKHQVEGVKQFTNSVLIALDILTLHKEKAWSFYDRSLNLIWGMPDSNYNLCGFRGRMGEAFFKREADIIEYGRQLKDSDLTISFLKKVELKPEIHAK
jgi:hypothetical protein